MSEEAAVVDGQAVEVGSELVERPATRPPSLFRTDNPAEILRRAKDVADALAPVIRSANLVKRIGDKDYLQVEAWQVCGQQVGVTPVVIETRKLTDPDGWEARCEARTLDGRTIGAADSMCLRTEERWADAEEFEIRSMAQTRAMSRALASVLRFIPTLAGFSGTPAEEMDRRRGQGQGGGGRKGFASDKQRNFFERLLREAGGKPETIAAITGYAVEGLTTQQVSAAIDDLKARGAEAAKQLAEQANDWLSKQSDVPADTEGLKPAVEPDEEVGA